MIGLGPGRAESAFRVLPYAPNIVLYFKLYTTYSQPEYPQLDAPGVHLTFTIYYDLLQSIKRKPLNGL